MVLGSCFAAGIGERLASRESAKRETSDRETVGRESSTDGPKVCVNPFGTLFNPVSVRQSIDRLAEGRPFCEADCVQMGAGSELWGSFSHYTKFARPTKEEFLAYANAALERASAFFREANYLIITFGTAYCFRHLERNVVVSNCLKRPASEFDRFRLSVDDIVSLFSDVGTSGPTSLHTVGSTSLCTVGSTGNDLFGGTGALAGKSIIFTVSPIRHLADGAHGNNLSKATLLLATEKIIAEHNSAEENLRTWGYFPAYEILMDELRDYRWYAEDGVHPSELATEIIFDRFEKDFQL